MWLGDVIPGFPKVTLGYGPDAPIRGLPIAPGLWASNSSARLTAERQHPCWQARRHLADDGGGRDAPDPAAWKAAFRHGLNCCVGGNQGLAARSAP